MHFLALLVLMYLPYLSLISVLILSHPIIPILLQIIFSGKDPFNLRQVNKIMELNGKTRWLANFVPDFIYIPRWMMSLAGNKL